MIGKRSTNKDEGLWTRLYKLNWIHGLENIICKHTKREREVMGKKDRISPAIFLNKLSYTYAARNTPRKT